MQRLANVLLLLWVLLLAVPTMAHSATLPLEPEHIEYLGWFEVPNTSDFNGAVGMSYVDDCMNGSDPSPGDGYPGCLAVANDSSSIASNQKGNIALLEIEIPTATGTNLADSVIGLTRIVGTLPYDAGYTSSFGMAEFDFFIDYQATPCQIVWAYYLEYGNSPADSDPIFGLSDCDTTAPNPAGMYRWTSQADADTTVVDPYRATKYTYNIRRMPSDIATDYFGGDEMLLGPGKGTGSRGSSAGPSMAVRPWTFPTDTDGWDELVPISYYNSSTGYTRWYIDTGFRGEDDRNWGFSDSCIGNLAVRINDGVDDYEALITPCARAIINTVSYPYTDANAAPTEEDGAYTTETYRNQCAGGYEGCGGVATGTYNWPDPTIVPVLWYGVEVNDSGHPDYDQQDPSFHDYCPEPDGTDNIVSKDSNRCPGDTNLISVCSHGTGPNGGLNRENVFFLWDLEELGEIYAGTSVYTEQTIQPYDGMIYQTDPDNDGWDEKDTCVSIKRAWVSMAYDETNQLLYIMRRQNANGSSRPYSLSGDMAVDVFSIDVTGGAGPTELDNTKASGVSADGGKIE